MGKILRGALVVYLVVTALHIAYVVHHEPFAYDAWNVAIDTDAKEFSGGRLFDYWWFEYTHSNPRVGQPLTYLAYKLDYFAEIATPLAYLLIALAVTTLGLRRLPSWRRGKDLALWAFATGALWFALPQLGKTLFCRAYAANYIYDLAIQLWFLVPLRLGKRAPGGFACAMYLVFGVIAGACNEHTGPTLCAFLLGYAWWQQRARKPIAKLAWFGTLGAIAGFLLLFFAPGQGSRYDDLAQRTSLVGRLLQRGVTGNLDIVRDLLLALAPVLGLIAIVATLALAQRDPEHDEREARQAAVRHISVALIAGLAMAATIFVSPKLGSRFYLASAAILLAGFIALADAALGPRGRGWLVLLAFASSIYAFAHTAALYKRTSLESEARIAALALARPGSVFIADSYDQVDDSWWFLGDDLSHADKRDMVARYVGLAGVVFHAYDPMAPLGVAGARFVPIAALDPPGCLDEHAGLALDAIKAFDLVGLDHAVATSAELVRQQIAPIQLRTLSVEIQLDDPRVALPRKHLVVAKWAPDRFEAYAGQITRRGVSAVHQVALPKTLAGDPAEIFIYRVGGENKLIGTAQSASLEYTPWAGGVYWVLACRPGADECFVVAATHHGA